MRRTTSAASAVQMVQFARQRLQYAASLIRTGGSREAVSSDIVEAVRQQVGNISAMRPDTATQIIEMVEVSPITQDAKTAIALAVQGKVDVAIAPSFDDPERINKQTFFKFPEYIQSNTAIAEAYHAERPVDVNVRLKMLAQVLRSMGCNFPSERTMAVVAACAVPEASCVDRAALTGECGKRLLETFKAYFKKAPTQINGREPQIFPTFTECEAQLPLQFKLNGFASGENNPIFDADQISKIKEIGMSIPLRWTNCMVTGPQKSSGFPVQKGSSLK